MTTHPLEKQETDRSPPETHDLDTGEDYSYVRYVEAWLEDEEFQNVWTLADRRPEPDESG